MTFDNYESDYEYNWYQDIEDLREAGFTVEQRSPWHFQVIGEKIKVNIWPTKKKFMIEYGDGASYYTDVVETVDQILNPKKKPSERVREMYAAITSEIPGWQEAQDAWRAGLKEFRKKRP